MMLTLAWKEFREHRSIWLTMVVMTALLGPALGKVIIASGGTHALIWVHLAIVGLAATYGLVCGSMMLAGEDEAGTLTFLDIFLGRRGLLWLAKFAIGIVLVLGQAFTVAFLLFLLKQVAPSWGLHLIGIGRRGLPMMPPAMIGDSNHAMWFLVLPVLTLEAFAWGLLGSAFSRRVLSAAAIAASVAGLVWIVGGGAEAAVFLVVRVVGALIAYRLAKIDQIEA